MSLLTVVQNVANEIGIAEPESVVSATDIQTKQILAHVYEAGRETKLATEWPELQREATITLVSAQANYALPADLDSHIFQTHWNQSEYRPLIGPLTPEEWQVVQSGSVASFPNQRFRIQGWNGRELYLTPTPSTADTGNIIGFEYQSTVWFRPKTWASSTSFAANSWCFYRGNFYKTTAGGTTSSTAPTHVTGSASDGAVTWAYQSQEGSQEFRREDANPYTAFTADSDVFFLPEDLVELGAKWMFKESKGLPYEHQRERWQTRVMTMASARKSAPVLNIAARNFFRHIGPENVPDTNFGS